MSFAKRPSNFEIIKKVRASTTASLKACEYLKETTKLRYYQVVGALNFLLLSRMVLGDAAGLGKTVQSIAAYCLLLKMDPTLKLLIVTQKSAVEQWKEEFDKFTLGVTTHTLKNNYAGMTGFDARLKQYKTVRANVLISGYYPLKSDYKYLIANRLPNFMVIFDECQEFKNRKTKAYVGAGKISEYAKRTYGLSATIIKNKLEEAYCIFNIIVPGLFGGITSFNKQYTKTKLFDVYIKGVKRKLPKIIGYKNLTGFRDTIDPYYLSRRTREVESELPRLVSKKISIDMTEDQRKVYALALNGTIFKKRVKQRYFEYIDFLKGIPEPTDKHIAKLKDLKVKYDETVLDGLLQNNKLAALSYCQLVSNGPGWVEEPGDSAKELEFQRLFEQELSTEKVIVFSRFKSGIPRLEKILDDLSLKHVRVTGDEDAIQRKNARLNFQDTTSNINVIFITLAGSAAINLQTANVLLFYDSPWSFGDLYQAIGRAQRIGSLHKYIYVIHLICKKTIDEHVLKLLTDKKGLSDEIVGDIAEGSLTFSNSDEVLFKGEEEGTVDALFSAVFNAKETI